MLAALCMCVSLAVFYGLCAAVRWPRSHPGATQPVQDSGTIGPCQNPTAPHLLSINASHSSSPSPSHTPPSPSPSSSSSSQTYLLILVFPTERHLNYTPAQSLFYIQFKHSVVLLLSLPPLQSISLSTFFFFFSFLFQWKNLLPIMSSVGSSCVWWQWTGNHRTFLVQAAPSH